MRTTASRIAPTLVATTVASTTVRCPQHGPGERLLDGPEVQVLEDGPGLARDEGAPVPLEDDAAVAERAVGEARSGLVEEHDIDRSSGGGLEAGQEVAELEDGEPCTRARPTARSVSLRSCADPRPREPKRVAYAMRGSASSMERSRSITPAV